MVRAILADQKTQTRRVMKVQPDDESTVTVERYFATVVDRRGEEQPGPEIFGAWWGDGESGVKFPYGELGDRLWVRESLKAVYDERELIIDYAYAADGAKVPRDPTLDTPFNDGFAFAHLARPGGVPSIHMPRWASRITLNITGVRVERLQAISEADARAEGVKAQPFPGPWWQGYMKLDDGELLHQQSVGESPPEWMIEPHRMAPNPNLDLSAADSFRSLWWSINGVESWSANPWVWVVEFERASLADAATKEASQP
jgi:hypothetical protein